jgi:hypothetical protein
LFTAWNIDEGGGSSSGSRYAGIKAYLKRWQPEVVGIVEAMNWENVEAVRSLVALSNNGTDERARRRLYYAYARQTAEFRRRATSMGYPYSHLVFTVSGFHLALLSVKPITVVYEVWISFPGA